MSAIMALFSRKYDREVYRMLFKRKILNAVAAISRFALLLWLAGTLSLALLPLVGDSPDVDERALLVGQVAKRYSDDSFGIIVPEPKTVDGNSQDLTIHQTLIYNFFQDLALHVHVQNFSYTTTKKSKNGVNIYAVLKAPRAEGTEAIVIAAPWTLQDDSRTRNLTKKTPTASTCY